MRSALLCNSDGNIPSSPADLNGEKDESAQARRRLSDTILGQTVNVSIKLPFEKCIYFLFSGKIIYFVRANER
jgi:hypothetical protein